MADISITAGSVIAGTGATILEGTSGGTITAGMPVYKHASDSNKIKPADADASADSSDAIGIALNGASTGQRVSYCTKDLAGFTVGATLASGDVLYLSPNAGAITTVPTEVLTGDVVTILGVMTSTTLAKIQPLKGGTK